MLTFFDLIIIIAMALIASGLLAIALMFLSKNEKTKKISFYITSILGIYMGTVGLRILWPGFVGQCALAVAMMLLSIAAIIVFKKKMQYAQIMTTVALVIGTCNAFFI